MTRIRINLNSDAADYTARPDSGSESKPSQASRFQSNQIRWAGPSGLRVRVELFASGRVASRPSREGLQVAGTSSIAGEFRGLA